MADTRENEFAKQISEMQSEVRVCGCVWVCVGVCYCVCVWVVAFDHLLLHVFVCKWFKVCQRNMQPCITLDHNAQYFSIYSTNLVCKSEVNYEVSVNKSVAIIQYTSYICYTVYVYICFTIYETVSLNNDQVYRVWWWIYLAWLLEWGFRLRLTYCFVKHCWSDLRTQTHTLESRLHPLVPPEAAIIPVERCTTRSSQLSCWHQSIPHLKERMSPKRWIHLRGLFPTIKHTACVPHNTMRSDSGH